MGDLLCSLLLLNALMSVSFFKMIEKFEFLNIFAFFKTCLLLYSSHYIQIIIIFYITDKINNWNFGRGSVIT